MSVYLFQGLKGSREVVEPVSAEAQLLERGQHFKLGWDQPQVVVLSTKNPEIR